MKKLYQLWGIIVVMATWTSIGYSGWVANGGGSINLKVNKNFSLIYQNNLRGDFSATGNAIMDGSGALFSSNPTMLNQDPTLSSLGKTSPDSEYHITSKNSSSAPLSMPSGIRTSHIAWAGLFWQGQIHGSKSNTASVDSDISGWNTVRMRTPDGAIHTITAPLSSNDNSHTTYHYGHLRGGKYRFYYGAYVDVTTIIKHSGYSVSHNTFTVGNIMSTDGLDNYEYAYFSHNNAPYSKWFNGLKMGHFGGWSLIVVYNADLDTTHPISNLKYKNISIYNGYDFFSFWTGHAGDAFETTLQVNGFKTPKSGAVSSKMLFFGGCGDAGIDKDTLQIDDGNNPGNFIDLTNSQNTGTQKFNGTYTNLDENIIPGKDYFQGMDLDIYDASSMMAHDQTSTKIKFGVVQKSHSIDQVFPQVIAFSTQLYMPSVCYDYDLRMGDFIHLTPEDKFSRHFSTQQWGDLPLQLKVMLRSKEADFDFNSARINARFSPNAFTYRHGESKISPNDINAYIPATETDTSKGQIAIGKNITPQGGTIGAKETAYAKMFYDLDTDQFEGTFDLDMDANITFVPGYPSTSYHFSTSTPAGSPGYIGPCDTNPVYDPIWGQFNVENNSTSPSMADRLPLRTQIAGKPYTIKVASYKLGGSEQYDTPLANDATVEVEVIDASNYDNNASVGFDATCQEPDAVIKGGFVHFDHHASVTINPLSDFSSYDSSIALRNAAFRVWALSKKNPHGAGRTLVIHHCSSKTDSSCFDDLYDHQYKTSDDNITHYCLSDCSSSAGSTCYDCLRKYFATPTCSRDNFAIRPEGFRAVVNDTKETNTSSLSAAHRLVINNTTASAPVTDDANLSAGYRYQLKMEATSFGNTGQYNDPSKRAKAYYHIFDHNQGLNPLPAHIRTKGDAIVLNFNDNNISCADQNNTAYSLTMINGITPDDTPTFMHDNAGRYHLWATDANWTRVDQGTYQYKTIFDNDCRSHPEDPKCSDCVIGKMTSTRNSDGKLGCTIGSSIPSNIHYGDITLQYQPYSFGLNTIGLTLRPQNNGFLFMNDFNASYYEHPTVQSMDMAAVYHGSVFALGKHSGKPLTNFTDGCAASDIQINLGMDDFNGTLQEYLQYGTATDPYTDTQESLNNQQVNLTLSKAAFEDANTSGTIPPFDANASDNNETNVSYGPGSAKMWVYTTIKKPTKNALNGAEGSNPILMHYQDLNATGLHALSKAEQTIHTPKGNKSYDLNATFLFARITPGRLYYPDVTADHKVTSLFVNVYCNPADTNCTQLGITSPGLGQNNAPGNWHLADMFGSPLDIGTTDLNVSTSEGVDADPFVAASGITKAKLIEGVPFDNNDTARQVGIDISVAGPGRPSTVKVWYDPVSPWLIYDPGNSFYRVKFIGQHNWSGVGNAGQVTNTTSSTSTQHRMNW